MAGTTGGYYVPESSRWPIIGSAGLCLFMVGFANTLNGGGDVSLGTLGVGALIIVVMMAGWFYDQIREGEGGMYNAQVDRSYRWGMMWFIFSEVMFFAAFFGALFYVRNLVVPWLGGEGHGVMTNMVLYPDYLASWPTNGPGDVGGAFRVVSAWDIPLVNTLILLASGFTVTMAHWALKLDHRFRVLLWQGATIALGMAFLYLQASEYIHAWTEMNLTLGTGIYGSTFYMLTGFHGLHVTVGTIMLIVIWFRLAAGHFSAESHFGFEAVAWYWHFVDVVWLCLFIFVYVL